MDDMTNKKLKALKGWLKENNISYKESYVSGNGIKMDLWIVGLLIAVHVGDDDGVFYKKTHKWCKPFFIRESESVEFILEKIQNCAYDQMLYLQRKWEKEQAK